MRPSGSGVMQLVGQALAEYAQPNLNMHFIANVDGAEILTTLGFDPERVDPAAYFGVVEQFLLEFLALGQQFGIVAKAVGECHGPLVDTATDLVLRVADDVVEEATDRVVDLVEDPIVNRLGDPPRRLLIEAVAERAAVVVEETGNADEHRVEEPLLMATFDGEIDCPADQWRDGRCAYTRFDEVLKALLDLVVIEHFEPATQDVGNRITSAIRVGWRCQPFTGTTAKFSTAQPFVDHVPGQEVRFDELAEAFADLVFAFRDDCGVRDRDPQWMSEERSDRKPVSECPDHRCFSTGADVADPSAGLLVDLGDDIDSRRDDQ